MLDRYRRRYAICRRANYATERDIFMLTNGRHSSIKYIGRIRHFRRAIAE